MTTILSGAGTYPAGLGPAGLDPVSPPSPPGTIARVPGTQVALFDLATRSFPRDSATGLIKRIHWVDQAVALALGVTNGTLSSQVTLGNHLRLIRRNDPLRLEAEVRDAVRIALQALLDRRDILVTDLQVSQPIRSQTIVVVSYVNLRTSSTKVADTVSFAF